MLELIKRYPAAMPAVDHGHSDLALNVDLVEARVMDHGGWHPESWKNRSARQQPAWPDPAKLECVTRKLWAKPGLAPAREVASLKKDLAMAAGGKAFILQGGDCSETFAQNNPRNIFSTCKTLARMAFTLSMAMGRPVVKIGRMAGQFAKPRSSDTRTVDGIVYPSYRGDLVNDAALDQKARRPNPERLLKGYEMAGYTLGVLESIRTSRLLSYLNLETWTNELRAQAPFYERHRNRIDAMANTLGLLQNAVDTGRMFGHMSTVYASHEALLLAYEYGLVRQSEPEHAWYGSSGHMLWIGERTRQLDSAHVELLRGLSNPIGVKVGPDHDPKEIRELCRILNPRAEPGRLSLITRFGRDEINNCLPRLIREIKAADCRVVWISDPMHGNTFTSASGHKTRRYEDIISEIQSFFHIHAREKTIPGGIHLEMTGQNVTECLGGSYGITARHLKQNYLSTCDPRLNEKQCLELACDVADAAEIF